MSWWKELKGWFSTPTVVDPYKGVFGDRNVGDVIDTMTPEQLYLCWALCTDTRYKTVIGAILNYKLEEDI